jgi:succinate dehydrogenase / fumarate reductase cytochrome b subunit
VATSTVSPRPVTSRRTTIALKVLMAVTGLIFVGFVLAHMYGNLKVLSGETAFNEYAEHLRTFGEPILPRSGLLWILRVVLVVALVGHVYAAFQLWSRAGSARRTKYAAAKSAFRSKAMRWGGVFIFLFLIWHLIHFTIGKLSVNPDKTGVAITQNPYQLVVASFQVWWMTLIYVAAMAALALHLSHGVFSAQQTLGWTMSPRAYTRAKAVAHLTSAVVVVGFLIPPLLIQFGAVS